VVSAGPSLVESGRPKACEEVTMWVWSDELARRLGVPEQRSDLTHPLVAYAVEPDVDLDAFAVVVLGRTVNLDHPATQDDLPSFGSI
jgi:hypothetical protein